MDQSSAESHADSSNPRQVDELVAQSKSAYHEGRIDDALQHLDEALRLDAKCIDALVGHGIIAHDREDHAQADADFSTVIALDPTSALAYLWRGASRLAQKQLDEAIADYSESIRLDPTNPTTFYNRGTANQTAREYEAGIADYSRAIQLGCKWGDVYLYRAQCLYRLDENDAALTDIEEALRRNPQSAEAIRYRGRIHAECDEYEMAIVDYTAAIELDPTNADAFSDRGRAWNALEKHTQAVADFTESLRLSPNDRWALEGRRDAWDALGEPKKADADDEAANALQQHDGDQMPERQTLILTLLQNHFGDIPTDSLTITERRFPGRVRADLQRAINGLFQQMHVCHFCGVRKQYAHDGVNFTDLLVRDRNDPPVAVPPQYEEIDIGEEHPLRCLKEGLWLLEENGAKFAVFLEPGGDFRRRAFGHIGMRFQVATLNNETGTRITQSFFKHLERSVQEARSYRGKILSLEQDDHGFSGTSSGITVHKLRSVERDQVILPRKTLELLDRNVVQFVRQRPQLAKLGLSTRKGLLFYGPPGVGKTHTLHYLAGAIEGMTTLLISAEQIGLLGEYMTLARLLQPSMVVIEDADLIARERTSMQSACEEVMLNKLLNEMDGLKDDADILFILTTNRPETLEAALASRPGRIDQSIEFPLPDEEGRRKLIQLYSRGLEVPGDIVDVIVKRTTNVSASFIKELMRRSAQFQLERGGSGALIEDDIGKALEELLFTGGSLNRKLLGGQVGD